MMDMFLVSELNFIWVAYNQDARVIELENESLQHQETFLNSLCRTFFFCKCYKSFSKPCETEHEYKTNISKGFARFKLDVLGIFPILHCGHCLTDKCYSLAHDEVR